MIILAIDPGPVDSGVCLWVPPNVAGKCGLATVAKSGLASNENLRHTILTGPQNQGLVVIEGIESYGMAVGRDVFETAYWIGRFTENARTVGVASQIIPRSQVKLTLCQSRKAKDPEIRARILDLFGGRTAQGTKKAPGPLYGVSGHGWSALALALTAWALRGGDLESLTPKELR